jgi:ribosomal protein L37AE/L43A
MKLQKHPHLCADCGTRTVHYQGNGWFRCAKCRVAWRFSMKDAIRRYGENDLKSAPTQA